MKNSDNKKTNNEENEVFTFLVEVEWDLDQPEEEDKEYTYDELLKLYGLPAKFEIKSTFDDIADTISDEYGWCLINVDVIANMDRLVY
jgi:hypothetical protein